MSFGTASSELATVPTASLDDLDLGLVRDWLRENLPHLLADDVTLEDALMRLRLASFMGTRVVPSVAAVVAFGKEPQWLLPNLGVTLAAFSGTTMTSDVTVRRHLTGPFAALHRSCVDAIVDAARVVINHADGSEHMEFPVRAVREVISNALIHRDLRATGPVQIRVFPGRLEVYSPGPPSGLPESLEHYAVAPGVSLPRNPTLAVIARQLGLAEQLGRGLALIQNDSVTHTGIRAELRATKDGVTAIIPSELEGLRRAHPERN